MKTRVKIECEIFQELMKKSGYNDKYAPYQVGDIKGYVFMHFGMHQGSKPYEVTFFHGETETVEVIEYNYGGVNFKQYQNMNYSDVNPLNLKDNKTGWFFDLKTGWFVRTQKQPDYGRSKFSANAEVKQIVRPINTKTE